MFKKQIAQMKSNDEWISVTLDEKWRDRFTYLPETKLYIKNNPVLNIRIVREKISYVNGEEEKTNNIIYLTNLQQSEFSGKQIADLYKKRWSIETGYRTMKSPLAWERSISDKISISACTLCEKILHFNIEEIIRKELDQILIVEQSSSHTDNKYDYQIYQTQLIDILQSMNIQNKIQTKDIEGIIKILDSIKGLINKLKVPIRDNWHYKRWVRKIADSFNYRNRKDGLNNPKVRIIHGKIITVAP